MYTTQEQIRKAFWHEYAVTRKPGRQNNQDCDTRQAFCDFIEYLRRNGLISETLAYRVTL